MKISLLLILLLLNIFVRGQAVSEIISFSDWEGKNFPVQDWISINGDTLDQSFFKGKVCFFSFLAAYCPPCLQEINYLNRLKKHYSEVTDIIIIGFYSGDKESYLNYIKTNSKESKATSNSQLKLKYSTSPIPDYLIVAIDPNIFKYKYNVWGVPKTLILDKHGIVHYWCNGFPADKSVQENLYSEYVSEIDKLRQ